MLSLSCSGIVNFSFLGFTCSSMVFLVSGSFFSLDFAGFSA